MRRTLQVLNGLGPQESISVYEFPYDHPYFGQIFLAGLLSLTGYPQSLRPSLDSAEKSIPMLYEIPRLVMGILAIIDTLLLFKIADIRYGKRVAFISSTLFAVMPVTWFLRMILLENIMLPFILSSVLLLLYTSKSKSGYQDTGIHNTKRRNIIIVLISGILFGLACFTKESAVTLIPLLIYLAFTGSPLDQTGLKRARTVAIWLIPVVIISLIWPIYAVTVNQFDNWLTGVLYQAGRDEKGMQMALSSLFEIDPVFAILSGAAVILNILDIVVFKRRDLLLFFWCLPYFLFLLFVGGAVKYFHFIMLLPVLSIYIAILIIFISKSIRLKKMTVNPFVIIGLVAFVGLISTTAMISSNLTSVFFEMYSSVVHTLPSKEDNPNIVTLVGKHYAREFYWIPKYVFGQDVEFVVIDPILYPKDSLKTEKVLMLLDKSVVTQVKDKEKQDDYIERLKVLYHDSTLKNRLDENWTQSHLASIYPYSSFDSLLGKIGRLDIRTNY
jgi:MFS family permease